MRSEWTGLIFKKICPRGFYELWFLLRAFDTHPKRKEVGGQAFEHTQLVITPIEYDESHAGTLTMDEVLTLLAGDQAGRRRAEAETGDDFQVEESPWSPFEAAYREAQRASL
jgi:hypothetical protein